MRLGWHVLEPANPFVDGPHLHAICDHLEAVTSGQIRNLVINMPPRHAKSLLVSVFWPVWEWLSHPERRWLFASYALSLSIRDSLKCRRLIESPWFQGLFSDIFALTSDQNAKLRFENDHTGYRIATSVGGTGTGEGGDRIVVDDPHNVVEAESETIRGSALRWWDESMSTRGNDPKTVARIIVMQRVHETDLSGHVLEQGGYVHLCLPAEYEAPGYSTPIGHDWRTVEGELLWPERFGLPELSAIKLSLGSHAVAGQLQQQPSPRTGGMFKRDWWQFFDPAYFTHSHVQQLIQVWDTAFKTKQENDYSVCSTWALLPNGVYILDVWRDKVEFPDLKRAAALQYAKWHPSVVLIEDKASGQSLVQELQRETGIPIVKVSADADKSVRAAAVTSYVEAKRVFLPTGAAWVADWIDEHAKFPSAAHDDQVDTTSIALKRLVLAGAVCLDDDVADALMNFRGY